MSLVNCTLLERILSVLFIWSFFTHSLLLISVYCALLTGEFIEFSHFNSNRCILYIFYILGVYLYHTVFILSLCGLLEGEFNELLTGMPNFQAFIMAFVPCCVCINQSVFVHYLYLGKLYKIFLAIEFIYSVYAEI